MSGFRLQASGFSSDRRKHSGGFTLVELLMVITIIGILTGISVTVVRQAYHTARVARTNATIAKLDRVLMEMYADYENRRVPSPNFTGTSPEAAMVTQAARLWFLRDMIRMEMPCNKAEIEAGPVNFSFRYEYVNRNTGLKEIGTTGFVSAPESPLRRLYAQEMGKSNNDYLPAKCLYLVVMYGNPEVRELFQDREIATDPEDNLSYFVDGWGNPIYFLRWAPGLALSERQPNVGNWSSFTDEEKNAVAVNKPDPLDPTEVGGFIESCNFTNNRWEFTTNLITEWTWKDNNNDPQSSYVRGWALLPVVMSSGGEPTDSFDTMKLASCVGDVEGNSNDAIIPTVDPFYFPTLGSFLPNKANHAVIHNHSARR